MKFLIHKSKRRQPWYYTLVADNGEVLMTSENFFNKDDIYDSIVAIQLNVTHASVEEILIKKSKL